MWEGFGLSLYKIHIEMHSRKEASISQYPPCSREQNVTSGVLRTTFAIDCRRGQGNCRTFQIVKTKLYYVYRIYTYTIVGKQLSGLICDVVMFDWRITIQGQSKDNVVFFSWKRTFRNMREIKLRSIEPEGISAHQVTGTYWEVPPMEELSAWSSQKRASCKCKIQTQSSFEK